MPALPSSLTAILSLLRPAFTAPTFQIFEALVAGLLGRIGEHTVTGMWQAARLAGKLHHSRAHDFFARAVWCPDHLGLLVLDFLLERFTDAGAPITLAVNGSVFRRSGPKVHGASWHHDSSAASGGFKFGNCFVVVGLVVKVPALGERAWCLPVLFRLWLPTPKPTKERPDPERRPSQQDLAAELVKLIAERYPQRRIDVLGDSAFACKAMAPTSDRLTLTSRLRSNAVIHAPKPPPTGRRGRPRVKGRRLGTPAEIAARAKAGEWRRLSVRGRGEVCALIVEGLWYSVFGPRAVRVAIVREPSDTEGYRIALITTDVEAEVAEIVALRRPLVDRGRLPGRQADGRGRRGAQPGQAGCRAHGALRPALPERGRRLVRTQRGPRRRRRSSPARGALVLPEARPVDARHPRRPATRADPG